MTTTIAGTKYVDLTSGDDTDTGGSGDPYKTIGKAFDVRTGTSVWQVFVTGEATITTALDITNGVAPGASNPSWIFGWPGQSRPVLTLQDCSLFTASHSGTCLEGFEFVSANTIDGRLVNIESYTSIHNCIFTGNAFAVAVDMHTFAFCSDCLFQNFSGGFSHCFQGLGSNGQIINCKFINCNTASSCITTATAWAVIGCYIQTDTAIGINTPHHSGKAIGNVLVGNNDGSRSSNNGMHTSGDKVNTVWAQNYVEGFNINYRLNNHRFGLFRHNVSIDAGAGHWSNVLGPLDPTNRIATRSWLRGDWVDERVWTPYNTDDRQAYERGAQMQQYHHHPKRAN